MIDWKRKLSSRKLWVAIVGFVTAIATAFGAAEGTVAQISGIIMAGATLIAYILSEGWVDASGAASSEAAKAEQTDKTE